MIQPKSFTVLVPRSNPALTQDLKNGIRFKCPRSGISLKQAADDYCRIEVAAGTSLLETWWAVRQVVSDVERRHKSGRVIEMIG
jgi:hypothetical protein